MDSAYAQVHSRLHNRHPFPIILICSEFRWTPIFQKRVRRFWPKPCWPFNRSQFHRSMAVRRPLTTAECRQSACPSCSQPPCGSPFLEEGCQRKGNSPVITNEAEGFKPDSSPSPSTIKLGCDCSSLTSLCQSLGSWFPRLDGKKREH